MHVLCCNVGEEAGRERGECKQRATMGLSVTTRSMTSLCECLPARKQCRIRYKEDAMADAALVDNAGMSVKRVLSMLLVIKETRCGDKRDPHLLQKASAHKISEHRFILEALQCAIAQVAILFSACAQNVPALLVQSRRRKEGRKEASRMRRVARRGRKVAWGHCGQERRARVLVDCGQQTRETLRLFGSRQRVSHRIKWEG